MGKIPNELREVIAWNIRECRYNRFPGQGGSKQCAEAFKVPPQQWSHWETGKRTPSEASLARIAQFFDKTVEYMRRDNRRPTSAGASDSSRTSLNNDDEDQIILGTPESFYWLVRDFLNTIKTDGIKVRIDHSPPDIHDYKCSDRDSK